MDHRGRREHFGNLPLASRSSNHHTAIDVSENWH